ncbi:MAG: hypothetical protein HUJ26_24150 [Planctomycetaceae bacterium]|nr:hypothetical protein [Planctomycetaceae bacterium]
MRSAFFATGLFLFLWGFLFLLTQQIQIQFLHELSPLSGWWTLWSARQGVFYPPEWAGFSLGSAGALMMIYAVALPRRQFARPAIFTVDRWRSAGPLVTSPLLEKNI